MITGARSKSLNMIWRLTGSHCSLFFKRASLCSASQETCTGVLDSSKLGQRIGTLKELWPTKIGLTGYKSMS